MQKKPRTLTKESLGWGVKNGSTWGGRVRDKWKGLSLGWLAPTYPAQPWTSFLRRDQIWTNLVSEPRSAGLKVAQQGGQANPSLNLFLLTFSSFWPLVQTFSPRYKLLQITDLCSSHQKCSLELNRFLVLKPFMIFCLFYVKQMDWGIIEGTLTACQRQVFETYLSEKYYMDDFQASQQSEQFFSNLEFWTILVGIATLRHLFLPLTLGPCECPTHQYLFDPTFLFPRDPPSHLGLLLCKLSMESFVEIGKVLTRCTSLIEICTFTFTWGWFHSKFKE